MGSYEDEYEVDYAGDEQRELPEIWHVLGEGDVGKVMRWLHDRDEDDMIAQLSEKHPGTGQTVLMWAVINKRFVFAEWMVKRFGRAATAYASSTHLAILDRLQEELRSRTELDEDAGGYDDEALVQANNRPVAHDPEALARAVEAALGGEVEAHEVRRVVAVGTHAGAVDEDGVKQGPGVALYPNGDFYVGAWKNDVREGAGLYVWTSASAAGAAAGAAGVPPPAGTAPDAPVPGNGHVGAVYIGGWRNGLRHGEGRMTYRDHSRYYGSWLNGRRDGQGRWTSHNGDVYDGQWRDGQRHGYGTLTFAADQSVYVGRWARGEIACGRWLLPNGSTYIGAFRGGRPFGPGCFLFGGSGGSGGSTAAVGAAVAAGGGVGASRAGAGWRGVAGGGTYRQIGDWVDGKWRARKLESTSRGVAAARLVGAIGRHADVSITFAPSHAAAATGGGTAPPYVVISARDEELAGEGPRGVAFNAVRGSGAPLTVAAAASGAKGPNVPREIADGRPVALTHGSVQELALVATWQRLVETLDALPAHLRVDAISVIHGAYTSADRTALASVTVQIDAVDERTGLVEPLASVTAREAIAAVVVVLTAAGQHVGAVVRDDGAVGGAGGAQGEWSIPTAYDADSAAMAPSATLSAVARTLEMDLTRGTLVKVPTGAAGAAAAAAAAAATEAGEDPVAAAAAASAAAAAAGGSVSDITDRDGASVNVYVYRRDVCVDWLARKAEETDAIAAAVMAGEAGAAGGVVVRLMPIEQMAEVGGLVGPCVAAVADALSYLPDSDVRPMRPTTPPPPPREPAPIYSEVELQLQERARQDVLDPQGDEYEDE